MSDDPKTTDDELDQRTMGLDLEDLSFAEVDRDGRHRTLALDADELRRAHGLADPGPPDDDDALVQPTMPMSAGMLAAAQHASSQQPLGDPLDSNTQPLGPDEARASAEGDAVSLPFDAPAAPMKLREPAAPASAPPAIRGAAIGCVVLAVLTLLGLAAAILLRR